MYTALYRGIRLAWRYRSAIALALTIIVTLWDRNRDRLPTRLQKYEPPQRFVSGSGADQSS